MELIKAIEYLKEVIENKLELKHYKHRVELAQDYFDYYTGNLNAKLQRMLTRETPEEFTQRINLTNHVTKSNLNSTKLPFYKAARKKPIVKKIDYTKKEAAGKVTEIETLLKKFNGEKSLDQYLEIMMVEFNNIDPNAFLIIEFKPNTETEKAKPYPFIAVSKEVVDYNYINGELDYVIVRLSIKYSDFETVKVNGKDVNQPAEKDGFKYTIYLGNQTVVYRQVGVNYVVLQDEEKIAVGADFFAQVIHQVQADGDPELLPAAIQFGYIPDPETNLETYLGIFDCAVPLLRKTLKVNSESDQSMAMMAFPQRFMFAPPCQAEGCNKGYLPDGKECPACGGSGTVPFHKGSQDIITLALPRTPEEMADLENMLVYKTPPIELLKHQQDYLKELKIEIHKTIFNVDVFTRSEVSTTATEKILDSDNMNDTLHAFTRRYSQVWQKVVFFTAVFTENAKAADGIIIQHEFPKDLKMKGISELMDELTKAKESDASPATIAAIENDINEILYADRPDELNKIRKQAQFNPFNGYSADDIKYIISSGLVDKFTQTLYANYVRIWGDLERENETWVYDMVDKRIWDLLTKKVEEIMQKVEDEKPKLIKLNFNDTQSRENLQSGEQNRQESGNLSQQKAG